MSKPNALFIAPVLPAPDGAGLRMRAHHTLSALASEYAVHLLVVHQRFAERAKASGLSSLCRDHATMPIRYLAEPWVLLRQAMRVYLPRLHYRSFSKPAEWIYLTEGRLGTLSKVFRGVDFELVHVHRLYTFPVHEHFPYGTQPRRVQLDLDDIESRARRSIGRLYGLNGDKKTVKALAREAELYEPIEREALASADRVFTCSTLDRDFLRREYPGANVEVVPNVVSIPTETNPPAGKGPFVFLFVGALGYYPNHDAVRHFCRDILPEIRRLADRDFTIRIVGRGPAASLRRQIASASNVDFVGEAPDLAPHYAAADAVVAPIRAGGGTRIKILEAFAHRRPVVASEFGAEGLMAEHGTQVLLASSAAEFARHCVRLMVDDELRQSLAERALGLVREAYTIEAMKRALL